MDRLNSSHEASIKPHDVLSAMEVALDKLRAAGEPLVVRSDGAVVTLLPDDPDYWNLEVETDPGSEGASSP